MLGRFERGDTIVEVMFAFAVFGAIAAAAFLLMNQGTATLQRSLEVTLVREQIDSQAEMLRFLNQSYAAALAAGQSVELPSTGQPSAAQKWRQITETKLTPVASDFGVDNLPEFDGRRVCPARDTLSANHFVLSRDTVAVSSDYQESQVFAEVVGSSSYGIWIEAVRQSSTSQTQAGAPPYYDFHIRACWESVGTLTPMTLGTVVRLYEPQN